MEGPSLKLFGGIIISPTLNVGRVLHVVIIEFSTRWFFWLLNWLVNYLFLSDKDLGRSQDATNCCAEAS